MSDVSDAIRDGDATELEALLDADPARLDAAENGVTPLLLALYYGKPELARWLVERGARVSFAEACAIGDRSRVTSMLAADAGVLEVRTADGFSPLGLAIFFRHPDVARFLIDAGADVGAVAENAQRVAPVHAAATVGDRATMRLLLERGADANARQHMDYTPLHSAAGRGDIEMARLLLAHGADRDARTTDGVTPADIARKSNQEDFAAFFEG